MQNNSNNKFRVQDEQSNVTLETLKII